MPTNSRNRRFSQARQIRSSTDSYRSDGASASRTSSTGHFSRQNSYARSTGSTAPQREARQRAAQQRKRVAKKRGSAVAGARNRLKNFRQATILAVAITGFMLTLFSAEDTEAVAQDLTPQQETTATAAQPDTAAADTVVVLEEIEEEAVAPVTSKESADEALGALQNLWNSFLINLPKLLIAVGILVLAWFLTRALRFILHRTISRWTKANAITTLTLIAVWLLAVGVAVSVVAGDIRALVGSFGLIGLALSWSLQTPIESFTGWLLNSFQGYYRVGDRIRVGEVFGDVYRIDFLTTTVWEIGAPYQPGFVQAEQPTGRLVTFPNNEILTGTVINLTGDFPYVWDELAVSVANESDMRLAMEVLERVSLELLGDYMAAPARQYSQLLLRAGLEDYIKDKPQVFIAIDDSWTNIIIRYLVGARERRKWKSELSFRILEELNKPEYQHKIKPVYPRQQVQLINPEGMPIDERIFMRGGTG